MKNIIQFNFAINNTKNFYLFVVNIKFLFFLTLFTLGAYFLTASAVGPTFVSGIISADTTWTVADSPFVVQGTLTIASGVTLTIDSGVTVKFDSPASSIFVYGNLHSNGTLSQPVTFTSINDDSVGGDTNNDGLSTGQPGQWRAIFFLSGTSTLNHTNVFFGGTSHGPTILLFANLAVAGGNLTINSGRSAKSFENNIAISSGSLNIYGTEIDHAGRDGVLQTNGVTSIVNSSIHDNFRGVVSLDGVFNLIGNTFTGNTGLAGFIEVPTLLINSGNSASGNGRNGFALNGTYTQSQTLSADIPYIIFSTSTIAIPPGITLNIDPGVVLKFQTQASSIFVYGNLHSNGTLSQPVTFTSINDDSVGGDTNNDGLSTGQPGQWRAIFFLSGTSTLNHTNVFFGGTSHGPTILLFANLAVAGGNLTINSGRSAKSFENNIAISSGSLNIYGTEIDHAGRDGVLQTNGVTSIVNSSIHDNFRGMYVASGTAFITQSSIQNNASFGVNKSSPPDMSAINNFWGDSTGPFHPVKNSDGFGNAVSDNVLFEPFLLTNPLVNQAPFITNLNQFKSDGQTSNNESAITTEDTVIFKAILSDPQNNQSKLQVELRQFSEPFTGIFDGGILQSGFVPSGSQATIQRFGLVNGQYKWRARAIDSQNNESSWQEFGTAGNVDFEVKLVPLYTQIQSDFPSMASTTFWSIQPYAAGKASTTCGSFIRDCGCVITSEVMLMQFYGIATSAGNTVDPLNYNAWLTDNNGYKSNGDIKWPKINDYSEDQFGIPRLYYAGPIDSEDTNILNGQLNGVRPTLLHEKVLNTRNELVDHFIVADGKLSSTYTVKDPIFYLTKNLNQSRSSFVYNYNNNFLGLRLFSPVTILPDSISIYLASPGEILLIDPQNRKLGKDPINNIAYNEIPDGVYYQEGIGNPEGVIVPEPSKNIWIPHPISGQYSINVIGTESEEYTLGTLIYDKSGESKDADFKGTTAVNDIQEFELNYSADNIQDAENYRMVNIDIKPGSDLNPINIKSKGTTPVAILSDQFFNAKDVVISSVLLADASPRKSSFEDINNDGFQDLILHFDTQLLNLATTSIEVVLTGSLNDGSLIKGTDTVKILLVFEKRSAISKLLDFFATAFYAMFNFLG